MDSNGHKNNDGTSASFVFDAAYTTSHSNQASDEFSCHVRRSVRYSVTLNQSAMSTGAARDYSSSRVGEGVVLDAEWRCVSVRQEG